MQAAISRLGLDKIENKRFAIFEKQEKTGKSTLHKKTAIILYINTNASGLHFDGK